MPELETLESKIPLPASPAHRATSQPHNRLRKVLGCLGIALVVVIGLSLAHIFLLRPIIQQEIFQQMTREAGRVISIEVYQGNGQLQNELVEQKDINDAVENVWAGVAGLERGRIALAQDNIFSEVVVYGITLQLAVDVRADHQGNIVIKSLDVNWPFHLVLAEETLRATVEKYINDEVLRPWNVSLRAVQVTDEMIFLVYDERE